jgi:hypothetical protein
VYVTANTAARPPVTLELYGRATHDVALRLDDQERTIQLTSSVDATWVALDVVPGPVLAGASFAVASRGQESLDSFGDVVMILGGAGGHAIGAASVAVAVGVDAATGRWYRLSPGEIVVEFRNRESTDEEEGGN